MVRDIVDSTCPGMFYGVFPYTYFSSVHVYLYICICITDIWVSTLYLEPLIFILPLY